jgi:hypothetical protein
VQRTATAFTSALQASDNGLIVYDSDLKEMFLWKDTQWVNLAPTPASSSPSKFLITNPANVDTAMSAKTYSNQLHGYAISGIHKGTGDVAGFFLIDNATNTHPALYGETRANGGFAVMGNVPVGTTGVAGSFHSNDLGNTQATLYTTSGSNAGGTALLGNTYGNQSNAATFRSLSADNQWPALYVQSNSDQTPSGAIYAEMIGIGGSAGEFQIANAGNDAAAVVAVTDGTGNAGYFEIDNAASINPALYVATNGANGSPNSAAIVAETATAFSAIIGRATGGSTNGVSGISDNSNPGSYAVLGQNNGGGPGGVFLANDVANASAALQASTIGTGSAGEFVINNTSSTSPALAAVTSGLGSAGYFTNTNPSLGVNVSVVNSYLTTDFGGTAIDGISLGTKGHGGAFYIGNAANTDPALTTNTAGIGPAIEANHFANGIGLQITGGTLRYSVQTVSVPGNITQRAGLSDVTTTGSYTISVPNPQTGETLYFFNNSGGSVDVDTISIAIGAIKQFIYIAGTWRITN